MSYQTGVSAQQTYYVEIYEITLADTTVKRFTSFEHSIVYDSNTYTPVPGLRRTKTPRSDQFMVGSVSITLPFDDTYFTFSDVINSRSLDGSTLVIKQIDRKYFLANGAWTTVNTRTVFTGLNPSVKFNQLSATMSYPSIFNTQANIIPRYRYCQSCSLKFGSTRCGVSIAGFTDTGVADAGSTTTVIAVKSGLSATVDYYKGGWIEITSGTYDGYLRWVRASTSSSVTMHEPLPGALAEDDTFSAIPVCLQTRDRCDSVFSNEDNFFGFQYVPRREDIYS